MNDLSGLRISDQWIISKRGAKNPVDTTRPYQYYIEEERQPDGRIEEVATLFLVNRECRFRCLMCDLWKNTTDRTVEPGSIPEQIQWALDRLPETRHIKLYNSANFFDPGAVPVDDYEQIAQQLEPFDTVIVENHPNLTGERCIRFASMIKPRLQVAMGLETVHPRILKRLNKKMALEDFRRSVEFLKDHGIGTRAFILLKPPFMTEEEGIHWAKESLLYAFDSGIDCCVIIPTRAGNGAMEYLHSSGAYAPPLLKSLEEVMEYGIGLGQGLVFADTWDLRLFSDCDLCLEESLDRITEINLMQQIQPQVVCSCRSPR